MTRVRRGASDVAILLGCYAARIGSWPPTFQNNPFFLLSKSPRKWANFLGLLDIEDGKDRLSRKSVNNYPSSLRNILEE